MKLPAARASYGVSDCNDDMQLKVTKEDRELLNKFTDIELADFANKLNRLEWPDEIPNPEPLPEKPRDIKNSRRFQLMKKIELMVGKKLINRRWNKDRMTDAEHEEFWGSDRILSKT